MTQSVKAAAPKWHLEENGGYLEGPAILKALEPCANLEEGRAALQVLFPDKFVHRGGHHLAIAPKKGDFRRLVMIVNDECCPICRGIARRAGR
jgi:hypothetical protein